jgi:hypothetical protein
MNCFDVAMQRLYKVVGFRCVLHLPEICCILSFVRTFLILSDVFNIDYTPINYNLFFDFKVVKRN